VRTIEHDRKDTGSHFTSSRTPGVSALPMTTSALTCHCGPTPQC